MSIYPSGTHGLQVTPALVPIARPSRRGPHKVTWTISSGTVPVNGSLQIEFTTHDETKGPFMEGSPHGDGRGRYKIDKQVSMVVVSGQVDQGKNPKPPGYWKYKVEVFDALRKKVRRVDPGVAIDEGGGRGGG